jgi:hypothetical protein
MTMTERHSSPDNDWEKYRDALSKRDLLQAAAILAPYTPYPVDTIATLLMTTDGSKPDKGTGSKSIQNGIDRMKEASNESAARYRKY